MDEIDEIGRFENSVQFLTEGLEGRMNAELKQIESALEELKDADQRVQNEIDSLKNSDFEDDLNQVNNILHEFVAHKSRNRPSKIQLTEDNVVRHIGNKSGSTLNLVEDMINEIEGIEKDEETQLSEDIEAYQTIDNNLQNAINEHRAIRVLKEDLKKAKKRSEFEQHLREELDKINYDFEDVEELVQKIQQHQETSYETLKEIDKVLRDYTDNLNTLGTEMEDISDVLGGGQMGTLIMAKRLRYHCEEENWQDGRKTADKLVKRVQELKNYIKSVIELDRKIYGKLNSIESELETYRDEYRAKEGIM